MWKITTHKYKDTFQELSVMELLRILSGYSYIMCSESFINKFMEEIKSVKSNNAIRTETMYQCVPLSEHKFEVWKLRLDLEPNYKMATLEYPISIKQTSHQ